MIFKRKTFIAPEDIETWRNYLAWGQEYGWPGYTNHPMPLDRNNMVRLFWELGVSLGDTARKAAHVSKDDYKQ